MINDTNKISRFKLITIFENCIIAASYFVAGKLGFLLAIPPGNVSALFLPAGIALASVFIRGYQICIGVWLGSFLLNFAGFFFEREDFSFQRAFFTAAFIGIGATIQAVVGSVLLKKIKGNEEIFNNTKNILGLLLISGFSISTISATMGALSLCFGDYANWELFAVIWSTWWLGDTMGVLLLTPLILSLKKIVDLFYKKFSFFEWLLLLLLIYCVSDIAFGGLILKETANYPIQYVIISLILWITLRFGEVGAIPAIILTSIAASFGMARGNGPFLTGSYHFSLLMLQGYITITTITFLTLAAINNQRKIFANKLTDERNNLERKVQERTLDLKNAMEISEKANQAKSSFLAAMSHELRTPLNSIIGFSEIMFRNKKEPLTQNQMNDLQNIKAAGKQLLNLINEILDISKIESGKLKVNIEPLSIDEICKASIDLVKPLASEKKIKLTLQEAPKKYFIKADKIRFNQVILNLLSNSIKYNIENGEVNITCRPIDNNTLRISIQDTGQGIPLEKQPLLFEPFNRFAHEFSPVEGTGLGLSIAKGFVEIMGGSLSFTSEPNKGSCFNIDLPIHEPLEDPS